MYIGVRKSQRSREKERHKDRQKDTEKQKKTDTHQDRGGSLEDCHMLYNCMHYILVNNFMQFFKFYSQIYSYFLLCAIWFLISSA